MLRDLLTVVYFRQRVSRRVSGVYVQADGNSLCVLLEMWRDAISMGGKDNTSLPQNDIGVRPLLPRPFR